MPSESDLKDVNASREDQRTADFSVRTRKRKADVVIFLQDPDEDLAQVEMTKKKQDDSQRRGKKGYNCLGLQSVSSPPEVLIPLFLDFHYQGHHHQPSSNRDACTLPHMLIPTPDKDDDLGSPSFSSFMHQSFISARDSPLPVLGWVNRDELWKNMINKEQKYMKDKLYMQRHPLLQPKMRAILLDWLMEVCEVYKLHRETFYLAQDFFDRFMSTQQNVVKTLLQLIGISSLFIAAKLEEIYPPKLHQFAYVTDGACTEEEILSMELIIMKALSWNLSPLTAVSWLNVYLQVAYLNKVYEMLLPQYPQQIFVQIAELLDLCILDVGCLEYTYGILAASALYHFSSCELMQRVSGYELCDVEDCVKWMVPFALAIKEAGSSTIKHFRGIPAEDLHNIQTHINSFELLDKVQAKQALLAEKNRHSPLPTGVLTPPQSSKKLSQTSKPL